MKKSKKYISLLFILGLILSSSACSRKENHNTDITPTPTPETDDSSAESVTEKIPSPIIPAGDYDYSLVIHGDDSYDISDMLYGLFFEDINYAVDGGLYAEKIKNRSFEYGRMAANGPKCGWRILGDASFDVIDGNTDHSGLNENNRQYARITNVSDALGGIGNEGFLDGLSIEADAVYNFSAYLRSPDGYTGPVTVRLQDTAGNIYGESVIASVTGEWQKYETGITAAASVSKDLRLYVLINKGTADADMVSLFPRDTYKGRENGLRKDLAEALEALTPKFIRFPGGCVVEGESLQNAYDWKASIGNGLAFTVNGEVTYGDVAARPLAENLWGDQNNASSNPYYMTYGLGFYEYFLLCEDLGASPVPILNAGLSCLIQGTRSTGTPREAYEIGTPEFNRYVQDALDLVEFCRGDATTRWGAVRIAMGHEKPFDLTYIGIGNEQWGNVYYSRYEAFKAAFDQAALDNPSLYGDIKLIVANGPVSGDTYAWKKITLYGDDYAGLVDEHYYQTPLWFLTNTTRYDSYDRNSTPVFLGEYAAKSNNMEAALAEAAYMTGLERNGDIVKLASYAPLFGNGTSNQWTPDLLWFKNNYIWKSVNYLVQQLFSNNRSTKVYESTLTGNSKTSTSISGKIGVGTWQTAAVFDNIKVVSNTTGETLYSEDFSGDVLNTLEQIQGDWSIAEGALRQNHSGNPRNTITGDAAFLGDTSWTDYTLTLTATKMSGDEGFLIPIAVQDRSNYFHWNIGGWGNTVSCLEQIAGGSKSGQIAETVTNCSVVSGKAYELKIVVSERRIECYLDGQRKVNYVIPEVSSLYQVSGIDENGDLIVKLVNVSGIEQKVLIQGDHVAFSGTAYLSVLAGNTLSDMNNAVKTDYINIENSTLEVRNGFIYTAPKYSVTVIRVAVEDDSGN